MKNSALSGTSLPKQNFIARFFVAKRQIITEIISALFILLFVYTAINKFIAFDSLKYVLRDYPIVNSFPVTAAWALPVTEMIVSVMLFIPKFRKTGLFGALILMSAFTIYLSYMLITIPDHLPCTCGGMLQKLSWPQHFAFNIFFMLLAITALLISKKQTVKQQNESDHREIIFT